MDSLMEKLGKLFHLLPLSPPFFTSSNERADQSKWIECDCRSFVNSYLSLLKSHDLLSDNRMKFSQQLGEMSEELNVLGKEVDKSRKSGKELGARLERGLNEQEGLVEKVICFPSLSFLFKMVLIE